jgi:hypothetical protein
MIGIIRCICDTQTLYLCTPAETPKCPTCGRVWTFAVSGKLSPSAPAPAFAVASIGTRVLRFFGMAK